MANLHNGISDQGTTHDKGHVSPLDEERAASMADEGGHSGALMDIEDARERHHLMKKLQRDRGAMTVRNIVAAAAVLAVAGFAIGWWRRNA